MDSPQNINWLIALGPTLLVIVGGIITWIIKSKYEELLTIQEKLLEERRIIYKKILDPYIQLFSNLKNSNNVNEATRKLTSFEYKKTAFDLNLFGSDKVVLAYNEIMQYAYKSESTGNSGSAEILLLWGKLLLEIRKNLGNKKTKLKEIDMLKAMIKDIENVTRQSKDKQKTK